SSFSPRRSEWSGAHQETVAQPGWESCRVVKVAPFLEETLRAPAASAVRDWWRRSASAPLRNLYRDCPEGSAPPAPPLRGWARWPRRPVRMPPGSAPGLRRPVALRLRAPPPHLAARA